MTPAQARSDRPSRGISIRIESLSLLALLG
jgi:hypothetical protein